MTLDNEARCKSFLDFDERGFEALPVLKIADLTSEAAYRRVAGNFLQNRFLRRIFHIETDRRLNERAYDEADQQQHDDRDE